MKAISLWQPWASAISVGVKKIETRHWNTSFRGRIAIHAAKRDNGVLRRLFNRFSETGDFYQPFSAARLYSFEMLPKGAIVAVATLVDVVSTNDFKTDGLEKQMGDYSPNRYAWFLTKIKPLAVPYHINGRQGFFEVPDEDQFQFEPIQIGEGFC